MVQSHVQVVQRFIFVLEAHCSQQWTAFVARVLLVDAHNTSLTAWRETNEAAKQPLATQHACLCRLATLWEAWQRIRQQRNCPAVRPCPATFHSPGT